MPEAHRGSTPAQLVRRLAWGWNPMCRPGDRLEWTVTLTLVVLAFVAVPVSAAFGTATQTRLELAAKDQQANGPRVDAVLLDDAQDKTVDPSGLVQTGSAVKAAWTLPDGTQRTGRIPVESGARAGQRVTIWLDDSGAPARPPMRAGDITISAVLTALFVLLTAEVALGVAYGLTQALLNRERLSRWETEWEQVEPAWRRRGLA